MEHAPLRPVPARPAGPIDPAAAARAVAGGMPALSEPERRALALVALAERPREEAAAELRIDAAELGDMLARARKELRRTVARLAGSGWCERAERSISDRIDGALETADTRRLDIHLRNCPRCVEHERRLVQATDALLAIAAAASPAAPPADLPVPPGWSVPEESPAPLVAIPPEEAGSAAAVTPLAPPSRRIPALGWYALFSVAWLSVLVVVVLGAIGAL